MANLRRKDVQQRDAAGGWRRVDATGVSSNRWTGMPAASMWLSTSLSSDGHRTTCARGPSRPHVNTPQVRTL